jgi:NAD(P)H-dependent flavin oxidoreductase YrpB (nitropropane dioxygenase family)
MENKGATLAELLLMISGQRGGNAYITGEYNDANISISQFAGLIEDVASVKEIIDDIVNEAKTVMERLRTIGVAR